MAQLTPQQLRQIKLALQKSAQELIQYQAEHDTELSDKEFDKLGDNIRDLTDRSRSISAQSIQGAADEIAESVQKIQEATNKVNQAIKTITNIRRGIRIATALVSLGTAITAGNPGGVISAARVVLNEVT